MGPIVYLSDFGPLTNPWFPLGWDVVVVAVFSLVIFSWVVAVSLKTEEIEGMIIEVVVPEQETSML